MNAPLDTAFASQAAFRALMDAFARPGQIKTVDNTSAPAPFAPASAALIKSLADYETPVWLDPAFAASPEAAEWIRFQTGARLTNEKRDAAFALIADPLTMPDFLEFALGNEEYPDRSTTLIVQVADFSGKSFALTGPGIKESKRTAILGLPNDFAARLSANRELFPRGVDLVLVAGERVIALPRSIRISEAG